MRREHVTSFLLGFVYLSMIIGCSTSSSNPVSTPLATETQPKVDIPSTESEPGMLGHELLGLWNMKYDPEKTTATIEPNRELGWHFNVKSFIPTPGIVINSFDPGTWTIDVNVTLRNPFAINGYDVRLIIYTTDAGRTLLNADNWTPLFDIAGGDTINPFKAYAKSETNRLFAGTTQHTENLVIDLAGNFNVQFAVDASYPSNCEEPYQIGNMIQEEPLYDRLNDTCPVFLSAYRWNTLKPMTVVVNCPDILEEPLELETTDMEFFYGNVVNFHDASAGEYPAIITAQTDNPIPLYSIDSILVTEKQIYGWVKGFPDDDDVTGLETDEFANSYFALNPTNSVVSYNKFGMVRWDKDLNNLGPFNGLNDVSCHPDSEYIYCTGNYTFCGTSNHSGLSVAKIGKSSGSPTHNYQCFYTPVSSHEIVNDSNGNAYIMGTGESNSIPVMWKVNNMLAHQWNQTFDDSDGGIQFSDLEMSGSDTIFGTGRFWGTVVDLDPTSGTHSYVPLGKLDAFFVEYNSSGHWVNSRQWGGYNDAEAEAWGMTIGLDDNDNIIIGGLFEGTVDFNPAPFGYDIKTSTTDSYGDMYISKFNSSGSFLGCIQITVSSYSFAEIKGLDFDMYGNVYVCGYFNGTCDFDPGTGIEERTSAGGYDMFLAKYNSDLELVWVQIWGTASYYEALRDVAYDRTYNFLYVVGIYSATMDFDPGEGVFEMTPSADEQDPFLMRMLPNGLWEY